MSKLNEFLGIKGNDTKKLDKAIKEWESSLYDLETALRTIYKVVPQKEIMDIKTVHGSKDSPQRVIDQLGKVTDYLKAKK